MTNFENRRHLYVTTKQTRGKDTFPLGFLCMHMNEWCGCGKLALCRVPLRHCWVSGCSRGLTLSVSQSWRQAERHTASVSHVRSSVSLSLPPLSLVNSTALVPTYRRLVDGVQWRHRRGLLGFCWCVVPLENMTTGITSTRGTERGGMTDAKRQRKNNASADMCEEPTPATVIRHAPHNETLSEL